MTDSVALAVAAGSAVLAVLLLVVVVRLHRMTREQSTELVRLRAQQTRIDEQLGQLVSEQKASLHAVELVLQDQTSQAPLADPPAPDDTGTAAADDADVRLITGMSDADRDADDLTTARIASVALGGPLIKAAAFSHGVRRAFDEERRMRISYAVRKELRRQRKLRRRQRADQARSKG